MTQRLASVSLMTKPRTRSKETQSRSSPSFWSTASTSLPSSGTFAPLAFARAVAKRPSMSSPGVAAAFALPLGFTAAFALPLSVPLRFPAAFALPLGFPAAFDLPFGFFAGCSSSSSSSSYSSSSSAASSSSSSASSDSSSPIALSCCLLLLCCMRPKRWS